MPPRSQLHIDLGAVDRNLAVIREAVDRPEGTAARVCAVLKADGYGLGAPALAKRLAAGGVSLLAVFSLEQARALVDAAIATPILVLAPVGGLARDDRLFYAASRGLLQFTVHDPEQLGRLIRLAESLGLDLPLHLEVDTGMSRGGVPLGGRGEADVLLARINEHPRLRLAGVLTHHAAADVDAAILRRQHEAFGAWLDANAGAIGPGCLVHEANSFALWRTRSTHRSMVRVGLSLLGYGIEELVDPDDPGLRALAERLTPAVRWTSHVMQRKSIPAGATVGYGATWRAERPTRLAIVPVGYSDGYPLSLSSRATAAVVAPDGRRRLVPVVGRVSMDQITLDVTDLDDADAPVGAEVELVSAERGDPHALPELARRAGTITHELLCRLHPSIERRYLTPAGAGRGGAGRSAPAVRRGRAG